MSFESWPTMYTIFHSCIGVGSTYEIRSSCGQAEGTSLSGAEPTPEHEGNSLYFIMYINYLYFILLLKRYVYFLNILCFYQHCYLYMYIFKYVLIICTAL